jgi:hypothetical protein
VPGPNNNRGSLTRLEVDGVVLKVYDDKDWNLLTFGGISDSISTLAINSFGRLPPPTNPLFCGEVTIDFMILTWRPFTIVDLGISGATVWYSSDTQLFVLPIPTPSPLTIEEVALTN